MKEIITDRLIIRVYSPEITEDKRRLRTKAMHKAAEDLLKAREKAAFNRKAG